MNRFTLAALAAFVGTGAATAGGLDRSGQSVLAIFDDPMTAGIGLSYVQPSLNGADVGGATGTYDAGRSYSSYSWSFANEVNDRFSYAVIGDQPFGADIFYNDNPLTSNLGGTTADLSSDAISFIGKYQFTDRVSVFGGLRAEQAGGRVALNGLAYANAIPAAGVARAINAANPNAGVTTAAVGGALQFANGNQNAQTQAAFNQVAAAVGGPANFAAAVATPFGQARGAFQATGGYSVELEQDWGVGLTLGAAYEIPEIALRLAVTYHSEVEHSTNTSEILGPVGGAAAIPGTLTFNSPQSVNIDFQTGVNEKTLVLASMRWTDWDDFDVIPQTLGADLANIDDSYRWTLGVARRFSPELVGLASLTYEKDGGGATISPLGPTDGQIGLSIGARYTKGNLNVSGGINYTKVGDAFAGVGGQPVASFTDGSAVGVGLRVAYKF
ncbi:OmpP1/FadL family transporter [Jannaschia sp. M317]|uniref:OmpP1/FadL family transporter n=1 Tax=Jannaschia sp. M317 TaxID=2867011 RepID=UPI0021A5FD11|nr:outer membrane protein transport protein [Jannaschia sp. M317]UWQ17011.1 outer membrane protein transport protein [Jannaschia sp. M317]